MRAGWYLNRETVVEGFEQLPEAFIAMLSGGNTGKMIVKAWHYSMNLYKVGNTKYSTHMWRYLNQIKWGQIKSHDIPFWDSFYKWMGWNGITKTKSNSKEKNKNTKKWFKLESWDCQACSWMCIINTVRCSVHCTVYNCTSPCSEISIPSIPYPSHPTSVCKWRFIYGTTSRVESVSGCIYGVQTFSSWTTILLQYPDFQRLKKYSLQGTQTNVAQVDFEQLWVY